MTDTMRVVFMGTPDFAVPTLQALMRNPEFDVVGVVTQPDRPAGRGQQVQFSPVKETALAAQLPIIQPTSLRREPAHVQQIHDWQPDYLVVIAFGQILRQDVLDIPRLAPVNIHASLLPRWRGASPIQAALRAGDLHTGITTMQMDAGMDTGPILLQDSIPITPEETGQSLHDKLATMGAWLLIPTLQWLRDGLLTPNPQPDDAERITHAPQLKKEDGEINWTQAAAAIDRHVRAYTPWPGTYTHWGDKRLKILDGMPRETNQAAPPGEVISLGEQAPCAIGTGNGLYIPHTLQLAGRKPMDAEAFVNGAPDFVGSTLA